MMYKLYKTNLSLKEPDAAYIINENGSMTSFIFDPANTDYQQYLKWLDEGNTPEPAEDNNG